MNFTLESVYRLRNTKRRRRESREKASNVHKKKVTTKDTKARQGRKSIKLLNVFGVIAILQKDNPHDVLNRRW